MMRPKLVVLSGAGVSAESGLKTFRDSDGLWEGYDVYEVATPAGWTKNRELVLDFYNQRRKDVLAAEPNAAHRGIASLEDDYEVTVVTQNIDDLHERAGSSVVIHLHGEILKMRSCLNEALMYPVKGDIALGDKAEDGAQLRPHVVWFGEAVPLIEKAAAAVMMADVLVVVGTSLNVYPAAGLIHSARPGTAIYVIDKKIPAVDKPLLMETIEKPATEGMRELLERLKVRGS
ncbi:MAG TPA: Sir2 family NAD-dependent protein deacetylase [Chitinophagaceae bacterium]|nr:Sir2 family NAD-dependent protein deacetylase [Chitinophagaceae bacterium]